MTSSAHLQRETSAARANLSSTLDELRGSMTTTALTAGAMALAREGSTTLARAAVQRASTNPLAALLIGAGIFMLLSRTGSSHGTNGSGVAGTAGHLVDRANSALRGAANAVGNAVSGGRHMAGDAASSARHMAGDAASSARHMAEDAASGVRHAAQDARDAAGSALHRASGAADSALHRAGDAASQAADAARGYASSAAATASATASRVGDLASEGVHKAKDLVAQGRQQAEQTYEHVKGTAYQATDRLTQLAHEQPIFVAALAVAAGAAVGAALPLSEAEKRYLGEAGAKMNQKGRAVAGHVVETVAAKAGEVVSTATSKAGEIVDMASAKAGEAVKSAVDTAKSDLGAKPSTSTYTPPASTTPGYTPPTKKF